MPKKPLPSLILQLSDIIGGGQAIGTLESGQKCLVWGGLPSETVRVQVTKKKSNYLEGYVTEVITPSVNRIESRDDASYMSTSPWQIMNFAFENSYKERLIDDAFKLHKVPLPQRTEVWSDDKEYAYRNKVEFSFWYDTEKETLDLAFFRRGTHGKIAVDGTSLAIPVINKVAHEVLDILRSLKIDGRSLKTLLVRSDREGNVAWQLYVKDESFDASAMLSNPISSEVISAEIIYSNPKSPASVITKRLGAYGEKRLKDTVLGVPFHYATEGFFQINLTVYEQALHDMRQWIIDETPVVDLYSGVGSIGLTIGGANVTLVEINEHAVREMQRNIVNQKSKAKAVLAASENAIDYITNNATIIVDPPRAGLHEKVIERIKLVLPKHIIYLSCNPVTQARDISYLIDHYDISYHRGYNFFPRTPHIENLIVLSLKDH